MSSKEFVSMTISRRPENAHQTIGEILWLSPVPFIQVVETVLT